MWSYSKNWGLSSHVENKCYFLNTEDGKFYCALLSGLKLMAFNFKVLLKRFFFNLKHMY